ncbi:chorismate--pyruvate lyase family protein [Methermicoccus shengliensis]|uniref:chorismate--pyruvate lyase family protein n=1 Tax=Methermicoccus shengliensis TaxID=660064 RepID=UPI0005B2C7DE|nr:chorismate lyase [Methermicoccus shengliensis]
MDETLRLIHDMHIPLSLRICLATDGSLTHLLEVLFGKEVGVQAVEQEVVSADETIAQLLSVPEGSAINRRRVVLSAEGQPLVWALSLSALERMPPSLRRDIGRAEKPIGKILREHGIESRRELLRVERTSEMASELGCEAVVREYYIIHAGEPMMWIREVFPIDGRWEGLE